MTDSEIKLELLKCQHAVDKGYRIAKKNCTQIELSLQDAERQITLANSKQDQLEKLQNTEILSRQNEEIQSLRQNIAEIQKNIDLLYELRKDFSIAVFGRKMAGKSTLIKILTHGELTDNDKIKSGDITYCYWNGLKFIDVPSVDFFDDAEKDKRGMEAAKSADIVLFLLTNEEVQPQEAQCLAQLKSLGKPILGIVNIKKNLNFKKRGVALKELNSIFSNRQNIDSIIAKFKENAKKYHQVWNDIEFIPTHLAATLHAQFDDAEIYKAGNFAEVENSLTEKVTTDGRFFRVKNFIESVSVSMYEIISRLFEHSTDSLKESRKLTNKSKEILAWRQEIWNNSQAKLHRLFDELSNDLKAKIPQFVEENYNAPDINEKCTEFFQNLNYGERYQKLFEEFFAEYKNGLKRFSDELAQESDYSFNGKARANIQVGSDDTLRKYIIAIAPSVLMLVPGINLATVLAVTVGNTILNFFVGDSKSKLKEKICTQLNESGVEMLNNINNQAHETFNKQISGNIEKFSNIVMGYANMLARHGKSQSEIAETLIEDYNQLNTALFTEAVQYKQAGSFEEIRATMRIPGTVSVVIAEDSDVNTKVISALLNERFFVVNPLESWENSIRKMLGCDFDLDAYTTDPENNEKTFAIIPKRKVSNKRAKLTQQISPYPIMTE